MVRKFSPKKSAVGTHLGSVGDYWSLYLSGVLLIMLSNWKKANFGSNGNGSQEWLRSVRQVDRLILEHVSNTKGLASGLQFLCSSGASLSAVYLGLIHALKLVMCYVLFHPKCCIKLSFLHHFLFILRKLLQDVTSSPENIPGNPVGNSNISTFSSQGGFLPQPEFDASPVNSLEPTVDLKSWKIFSRLLSESMWPSMKKLLLEGKRYISEKPSQMTCLRLLELVPIVFEKVSLSGHKQSVLDSCSVDWLHDLVDWGKSSILVVVIYWKKSVISLMRLLKGSYDGNSAKIIGSIETLMLGDNVGLDELKEKVFRLSVSLPSDMSSSIVAVTNLKSDRPIPRGSFESNEVLDLVPLAVVKSHEKLIVLSDDEAETEVSEVTVPSHSNPSYSRMDAKTLDFAAEKSILPSDHGRKLVSENNNYRNFLSALESKDTAKNAGLTSQKHSDAKKGIRKETNTGGVIDLFPSKTKVEPLKKSLVDENISSKTSDQARLGVASGSKVLAPKNIMLKDLMHDNNIAPWEKALKSAKAMKMSAATVTEKRPSVLKIMIPDDDNDPWEMAVAASRPLSSVAKLNTSVTKRQVIQLNMPTENKSAFARRMDAGAKRLKPPRLDDWYRPMLEIDYFSIVGLSPEDQEESDTSAKLKKVPMCFKSPDHYVDIFRPLVLEEFKAQLRTSYAESSSSEEMWSDFVSVVSVDRVDDFNLVRCVPSDGESIESKCSENDLVLLTRQPLQKSAQDVHIVGKVDRREKDHKRRSIILVIRLYLQNGSTRFNKAKRLLVDRSKWYLTRIMSLTSQLREFQALSSLNDIPVLPVILKPTVHSNDCNKSRKIELGKLPEPLARVLKSSFNDSQLQAISDAIGNNVTSRDFELSLIQGPPGTGKTRTILAIVSALLALPPPRRIDALMNTDNPRSMNNQSDAVSKAWHDAAVARQLSEGEDNSNKYMENIGRGRVLICAQSNAAVDELVSRISNQGLYGSDGKMYRPYLVRVGNQRTVHPCSLPFFIDTLVDQRVAEEKMNENDEKNDLNGDASMRLRASLEQLSDRIRFYEAKRANLKDGNSDSKHLPESGVPKEDDAKEITDAALGEKLQKYLGVSQSRDRKASEEIRALRNKIRKSILKEAKIVVTTLSGCGGDLYGVCSESISAYKFGNSSEHTLFDAVVIDEAAQALEPATLIPLQLLKSNGTKCIMVGDPKQLPATVLSQVASKYLYECSMFERLQRAGHPVTMLTKQYRMHPEICQFPSLHFYDNKLLNGDQMASKIAPFHEDRYLGPYIFFDVAEGQQSRGRSSCSQSLCNESEAEAAVEVLRFFKKRYFCIRRNLLVGEWVSSPPYKSQVSLLRSRFSSAFGPASTADMEFNTVDGYQGREVDILILSTVRASDQSSAAPGINTGGIGFVADVRRMNVALTRAKLALWVFGNAATLQNNRSWGALVKNAEKRNLIVSLNRPYWSVFKKSFSDTQKRPLLSSSDSHHKHAKPPESSETDTTKYVDENEQNSEKASESMAENANKKFGRKRNKPISDDNRNKKPIKEDLPFEVGVQQEGRKRPKDMKDPVRAEHAKINQSKGKEIARGQDEKSRSVTKSVPHQETVTNKTLTETESGISLSSTEGKDQENEVKDDGKETITIETPTKGLIARRKRQRDAVDALLPSAFIPSKKIGTRQKSESVKRPRSPTATTSGAQIKPPKPKKGKRLSLISLMHGMVPSLFYAR
ncbi:hypothetical protein MKW92_048417 [Papaver armeniacum]|nr:hypothetical protein MKW92_048417 [Papaver armeniacum]